MIRETVQHVGDQIRFPRRPLVRDEGPKGAHGHSARGDGGTKGKGSVEKRGETAAADCTKGSDVIRRLSSHRLAAAVSGNNAKIWINAGRGRMKPFSEGYADLRRFPGKCALDN